MSPRKALSRCALALASLAALVSTGACWHGHDPPRAAPHAPDRVLLRVAMPAASPFGAFVLRRRFTSETHHGGGGHGMWGGGGGSRWEGYRWTIEPEAGASGRSVIVERVALPDAAARVDDDPARFRLVAARDGHAVAYSFDRGATWGVLALDLGAPWVHFSPRSLGAVDPPDPFVALSDSTTLAVQAFEAGATGALGVDPSADPSVGLLADILPTFCRTSDRPPADPRLVAAAARVFIRRVNPLSIGYTNLAFGGQDCLADAVASTPSLREAMRVELGRTRGAPREMAAWLLSRTAMAEDQEAIAVALIEPFAPGADVPSAGHERSALAWSLARATAHRRAAPERAVAALVAIAEGEPPLPYVAWNVVRVHAVRGLAAIATDPVARGALVRIGSGPCPRPLATLPQAFDVVGETDLLANGHDLPCWAEAALRAEDAGLGGR